MKSISVLAVAASIAICAAACSKKDEPVTSETNTTSAPITQDQPVVQPQVTTGTTTDTTTADQSGMTRTTGATMQKGKDAGIASDYPTGGSDLIQPNGISQPGDVPAQPNAAPNGAQGKGNHSTTLGDSKSGEYTGGAGTYGGKATWGTGPRKDTKMDQPTPATK